MEKPGAGAPIWREIAQLDSSAFSLAMATGIVSIAAYLQNLTGLAWALFIINIGAYAVLWLLTLGRLLRYPARVLADATSHARGPGFFTIIAATCVLGRQFVLLRDDIPSAVVLWFLAILLWLVVMYSFFLAATVSEQKPSLEEGLNGGWLLAVVATQGISLLGTRVASHLPAWWEPLLFFALTMYLIGFMLYLFITSLIFYRFMFFRMSPSTVLPPYWINMGAMAITTLSGATLISSASEWPFLLELLPWLTGLTLTSWAMATWWIPLLVLVGVWRHLFKRVRLAYMPQFWGLVFPLGMYSACTFELARATHLTFLFVVPPYFLYAALIAWALTLFGLLRRLLGLARAVAAV